jgi:hypothetical protein
MKVIFLDVDGVLNSRKYILQMDDLWDDPKNQMDPLAIARLNSITTQTGANIVVSSTWRLAFKRNPDGLAPFFASYGIVAPVIGMTDDLVWDGLARKDEIASWMDHNPVDNFVILDDETITGFPGHDIKTTFDHGLMDHHVDMAVAILNSAPAVTPPIE